MIKYKYYNDLFDQTIRLCFWNMKDIESFIKKEIDEKYIMSDCDWVTYTLYTRTIIWVSNHRWFTYARKVLFHEIPHLIQQILSRNNINSSYENTELVAHMNELFSHLFYSFLEKSWKKKRK